MLLIDADITCYASAAGAETEIEWDEDTWSIYTDLNKAKEKFQAWIDKVCQAAGMTEFKLCFTGDSNFRRALNPLYKSKRSRKPVGYGGLKQWAKNTYPYFEKPGLEADDCMGILATKFKDKAFPCTMDKDLLTIPGQMFHLNQKLEGQWCYSSEGDANWMFLKQALMGDATDGYGGVPGIGPKGAEALLKKHGAVWETVRQAYIKAGLTDEDAILNARMARILRAEDWDFDNEQPRLWTP